MPYMGAIHQSIGDAAGNRGFAYAAWNQNRQEIRMGDGTVIGQYSFIDPNGNPVVTYYDAGRHGFRVRSNNLPEAPLAEAQSPLFQAPKPVEDTAEVAEAKRVMADLHQKISSRIKRQAVSSWMHPVQATASWPSPWTPYNQFYSSLLQPIPMLPASSWITNQKAIETVAKPRQRREADPVWPTIYSMPHTVYNAKIQTKQLTPVEGRTPADTTQLKLTTVEHQVPTYGWQAGHPITYSLLNPAVMPINIQ